jgi:hypothetical protein
MLIKTAGAGVVISCLLCVGFVADVRGQVAETEAQTPTVAKLFYFSFDAYSLVAIEKRNIEESSEFKIQILTRRYFHEAGEHPFLIRLKKMFTATRGSEPLEDGAIRLKLTLPGETFFADAHGRVLRAETGELFNLLPNDMAEIDHDIEYLSGIVDMGVIKFTEQIESKSKLKIRAQR